MINQQSNAVYFLILPLFVLMFFFSIEGSEKEIRSGLIQNYHTQVEMIDLDDTVVFKIDELNDVILSKLFGHNEKINNQLKNRIIKKLYQVYLNNEWIIRFPRQLAHPLLRNYKFYYVDSYTLRTGTRPEFTLVLDKTKNKVYNFQRYDFESADVIFDGIKKSDIKNFNKILKSEKVKISTVEQALDICMFFANVAKHSMLGEIIFNIDEVEKKYVTNKLEDHFIQPSFNEYKDKYRIKFISANEGILFYEWTFDVFKNGRIDLIFMERI